MRSNTEDAIERHEMKSDGYVTENPGQIESERLFVLGNALVVKPAAGPLMVIT